MNIDELEAERQATRRKIDELTEVYLQQKETLSAGAAKMMRRKLGKDRGEPNPGGSLGRLGGG